jgi:hypothetical protein
MAIIVLVHHLWSYLGFPNVSVPAVNACVLKHTLKLIEAVRETCVDVSFGLREIYDCLDKCLKNHHNCVTRQSEKALFSYAYLFHSVY